MIALSPDTRRLVAALFPDELQEGVEDLLRQECSDNLPFVGKADPRSMERIRFAVLKLSSGDPDRLIEAIVLAQTDWRDLFVMARFAESLTAHQEWAQEILG